MKADLDRLMAEKQLDQIVVFGPDGLGTVNAAFNYFVKGHHIVGLVIKKQGQTPQLIHGVMERDDAAKTGLDLVENTRWSLKDIQTKFPDPFAARVELYRRMFTDLCVTGRVAFYGIADFGPTLSLLQTVAPQVPGLIVLTEGYRDLIQQARETKDADELARMQAAGRATCGVVAATQQFLQSHRVENEVLHKADGTPLTVAEVKRQIRRLLLDFDLEHPGDIIFAQGRDAGVPHNHGTPEDVVRLGKSIIFDILPRQPGGYYHDMTRSWSLGFAASEVQTAYNHVQECFQKVVAEMRVGQRTFQLQQTACNILEALGHDTLRKNPAAHAGYIHSLGHGLGLDVHESPSCPTYSDPGLELQLGTVITIEPGLYYPERGFGIRIEDTYVLDETGTVRSLTPFPQDLVVPM